MNTFEISAPEAGILFSALLSFSDDDVSEQEGTVMRKYYRFATAEQLQNKMEKAGFDYPGDLQKLESKIMEVLKNADREFQVRTLAVGLELAKSDGNYDQREMALLQKYADALGVSLGEAADYAKSSLSEVDENETYIAGVETYTYEPLPLTIREAAIALCTLVAFSDDDPSDTEAGVLREYFTENDVSSVQKKFTHSGKTYPDDILTTKKDIVTAFKGVDRDTQVKYLAVAYKTAAADGSVDDRELEILKGFCEELYIGLGELKQYFKASPAD